MMQAQVEIRNPRQNDRGGIDCEVKFTGGDWLPFTARADDPEQHGRQIYQAVIGEVIK